MSWHNVLNIILFFIFLVASVSSQGYMGTVTTGTGIISPITVGKVASSPANIGSFSSLANYTGSWSLDLKGPTTRHIELQIFQDANLIGGSGQMTENDAGDLVTVGGVVKGESPTVFISTVDGQKLLQLELSSSGNSIVGKYDQISKGGNLETGTVTGTIALPAGQTRITDLGKYVNPSATAGAYIGKSVQSLESQNSANSTRYFKESRSFYQSSNGQISSSDGTTVTSSTI